MPKTDISVVTPTTLAIDITAAVGFREILEGTQPYQRKLLRQAIFKAARGVLATQLADNDAAKVLTPAEF